MPSLLSSRVVLALGMVIAVGLSGCRNGSGPAISIGLGSWPGAEFLYLAQELELFAEEGVRVRIVEFDAPSDARRAFELGQLDGTTSTQVELLHLRESGTRTPTAVFVLATSTGAHAFLARTGECDGDLGRFAALRIGVEPESCGEYLLMQAVQREGRTLEDVTRVPLHGAAMRDALREGRVDAAVVAPPFSITLNRDPAVEQVPFVADEGGEVQDLLLFDADFLKTHIDDVSRVLRALDRAMAFADEHPERAFEILGSRVGLSATEVGHVLGEDVRRHRLDEQAALMRAGGPLEIATRTVYDSLTRAGHLGSSRSSVPTWSRLPFKRAVKTWSPR